MSRSFKRVNPTDQSNFTNDTLEDIIEDSDDFDTLPVEDLGNGPIMDRQCTDVLCCTIFLAFLTGLVGISGYGLSYGDPNLLLTTWDYDGNGCGYNKTTKDYPYLYYPSVDFYEALKVEPDLTQTKQILKFGICVKECPSADASKAVECHKPSFMQSQQFFYKNCVFYPKGAIYNQPFRYETTLIGGIVCAPSNSSLRNETVQRFKTQIWDTYIVNTGFTEYFQDIKNAETLLWITLGVAFVIGFIYMIVLRFIGGPILYLGILAILAGSIYGGVALLQYSETVKDEKMKMYYEYGAYTVWGITALVICCVLCCWNSIRVGIAVMKAAVHFISETPQVYLVPLFSIAIIVTWLVGWGVTLIYIGSIGELGPNPDFPFLTMVKWSDETEYSLTYSFFGFLWMNAFIIGVGQFIISAACAIWYFTSTSDSNGNGSIFQGLYWVFRYHLGSLAFGSFVIAVIQFFRIVFEYYRSAIEKANQGNVMIQILICLTGYLLDCFERFIKFVSENAYIQIAITGKPFCESAYNGFSLIQRNASKFGVVQTIGFLFNFLGIVFIMLNSAFTVYIALHYIPAFQGTVVNWIPPVLVGAFEGFIVGIMFMSVYSFAGDTIIQCYMIDIEIGRPDGNRPKIFDDLIDGAIEVKQERAFRQGYGNSFRY